MIPLGHYKLLDILARHKVPLVIIGGHAVNFHGHPRGTNDIDVIWLRDPASEAGLLRALQEVNACWISDQKDPSTGLERLIPVSTSYIASTHLMMLVTDFGFLDLFDFVPGIPDADVRQVYDDSVPMKDRRYVSLAWLKRMKEMTNRPRDIEDLEELA